MLHDSAKNLGSRCGLKEKQILICSIFLHLTVTTIMPILKISILNEIRKVKVMRVLSWKAWTDWNMEEYFALL